MGRLIDSNDVKELLLGLDSLPWEEQVDEIVDQLPTVDAKPIVRGKWIVKGQDVFCSHCDKEGGCNHWGASAFSDYCPNCGAKMDKEKEDGK